MDGSNITRRVALATAALVLAAAAPAAAGTSSARTRARHDLLARSDFPAGWTRSPTVGSVLEPTVPPRQVAACDGVRGGSIPLHPPKATSPEYVEAGDHAAVNEEVVVYPTLAGARAAFGAVAAGHAPGCAATYLNHLTTDKGTGTYAVTRLAVTTPVGHSTALAIVLSVREHAATVMAYSDAVVVQVGRTEATVSLAAVGSSIPLPLAERLAASAARRLG